MLYRLAMLCLLAGCAHFTYDLRPPVRGEPTGTFRAAVGLVDLTPLPGAPMGGYGPDSPARSRGYQHRLYARLFLFEDGDGQRFAFVQTDLPHSSGVLHRRLGERLADIGLSLDRILLTSNHSHGSTGNLMSGRFYNGLGSAGTLFRFSTDRAERLTNDIENAFRVIAQDLEPAGLRAGEVRIPDVTYNRSLGAWRANHPPDQRVSDEEAVAPILRVLRVDRADGSPMGTWATFPMHGVVVGSSTNLVHSDVLGAASRALSRQRGEDFVGAFSSGAAGDQNPVVRDGNHDFLEAERLGRRLAARADALMSNLGPSQSDVLIRHAYAEPRIRGAELGDITLCERPAIGVPVLGGSEGGRSGLGNTIGVYEGYHRRREVGCHGWKKRALGKLQPTFIGKRHFPEYLPIQIVQMGEVWATLTVPGEVTAQAGRILESHVRDAVDADVVGIVTLANEYSGYYTTPAEYAVQHYEGASSVYGKHQFTWLEAHTLDALTALSTGAAPSWASIVHRPGPSMRTCGKRTWTPGPPQHGGEVVVGIPGRGPASEHDPRQIARPAGRFTWRGPLWTSTCRSPSRVEVRCGGLPVRDRHGARQDDDAVRMSVWRRFGGRWSALWYPPPEASGSRDCRFTILDGDSLIAESAVFTVDDILQSNKELEP